MGSRSSSPGPSRLREVVFFPLAAPLSFPLCFSCLQAIKQEALIESMLCVAVKLREQTPVRCVHLESRSAAPRASSAKLALSARAQRTRHARNTFVAVARVVHPDYLLDEKLGIRPVGQAQRRVHASFHVQDECGGERSRAR